MRQDLEHSGNSRCVAFLAAIRPKNATQLLVGWAGSVSMVSETVRYLSLDWIRELTREVAESESLATLSHEHEIGITQVVTDGPEGDITYHLQVGSGSARFGAGAADPEQVKMEQSWVTAVSIATGAANAQEAFITGQIRLFGDQQALMGAQPVFSALDSIFSSVRERTSYE